MASTGWGQATTGEKAPEAPKPLADRVDSDLVGALKFRSIGPAFMSGRIADIALDPKNPNTWYVGV